tara:strand:+ start:2325 stop:2465 length:141 start_codon:yes stop_codon:yes gene_type:complete
MFLKLLNPKIQLGLCNLIADPGPATDKILDKSTFDIPVIVDPAISV